MTSALLATFKAQLAQANLIQARDKPAIWAALTLGLYCFLRGGEFTTTSTYKYTTCAGEILPLQLTGHTSLSPSMHPKQTLTGRRTSCQWQQLTPSPAQSEPCGPSYDPAVTVPPSHYSPCTRASTSPAFTSRRLCGVCSRPQGSHQSKPPSTAVTASGSGKPQMLRRPDSPAGSSRWRAAGKARPTSDTFDLLRRPSLAWYQHWPEGQGDDER